MYGHGGHLGHVISIMSINFLVPKSSHTKFGSKRPTGLRKASFNFHMKMTLGQGQEMTFTLNTHISS